MHKQRFFQLVLPYLKDGFQIVEEEEASAMEVDNVKDYHSPQYKLSERVFAVKISNDRANRQMIKRYPLDLLKGESSRLQNNLLCIEENENSSSWSFKLALDSNKFFEYHFARI